MRLGLCLIFFSISCFCFALVSSVNPFTAQDLQSLSRVSSPTVSSDGNFLVYSVRKWDKDSGKVTTHLEWLTLSEDSPPSYLTKPSLGVSDYNPTFSTASNTLFFLSSRSGNSQIWAIDNFPPDEGEIPTPRKVSSYPVDVDNLKASPCSGGSVLFSARVYPDCDTLDCTAQRAAEVAARGENTWWVYDKLFVRHWDRWDDHTVSHLFLQNFQLDSNGQPFFSDSPVDLMFNLSIESPVDPFGGAEQFECSPKGDEIAFTGDVVDAEQPFQTGWRIYTVALTDSSTLTRGDKKHRAAAPPVWLTKFTKARTQNPHYSPSGQLIAFLAMDRPGLESDRLHLVVYNRTTQAFFTASNIDRSISDFAWVDEQTVIFTAEDVGYVKLFTISFSDPKNAHVLTNDTFGNGVPLFIPSSSSSAPSFIVQRGSWSAPDDLWRLVLNNGNTAKWQQLTQLNAQPLANLYTTFPDTFFYASPNGLDSVQGWLFKPIGFDASKTYPLAFLIHGGPEGGWESSFSYRWNPLLWASQGYAVVMINPHGSSGRGQKFQDAVINNWGGLPYDDLMAGFDYAVKAYPWIDGNRACACGASYGSYMINWVNGHTDRFKCLVSHDGVFSTRGMAFSTEELWFNNEYCDISEQGCTPWEKPEGYEKWSPEFYVGNWKTPTLVIHGGKDYRIPISQGLSTFTALQWRNIPSKLLYLPLENHWTLRAENSIKWYQEVLDWLNLWTNPEAAAKWPKNQRKGLKQLKKN